MKGAVRWPPRREAIKKLLSPSHVMGRVPLLISPECELLTQAFETKWVYEVLPMDQVDRVPKKPNSPWADIGDAAAYVFAWLAGGELMDMPTPGPMKVEMDFSLDALTHTWGGGPVEGFRF